MSAVGFEGKQVDCYITLTVVKCCLYCKRTESRELSPLLDVKRLLQRSETPGHPVHITRDTPGTRSSGKNMEQQRDGRQGQLTNRINRAAPDYSSLCSSWKSSKRPTCGLPRYASTERIITPKKYVVRHQEQYGKRC